MALLAVIAWIWIAGGAGMTPGTMASLAPASFDGATMGDMAMSPAAAWPLVFSMWLVMMVAMMLPSAAPTVLLYARAAAFNAASGSPAPPTAAFLFGYLVVWAAFSAVAASLQSLLQSVGLLSMHTMGSSNRWLAGGILIAAGIYQLTPLKSACLAHCRSPAEFLSRHYRAGSRGAFRLGILHGAFCFGCCWTLMLLLFVGGVMNLVWIAALTIVVALEKLLPWGRAIAPAVGIVLLVLGAAMLLP